MALAIYDTPEEGSFEGLAELFHGYITMCRQEWSDLPDAELEANVVRLGLAVRERLHKIAITSGGAVGRS